MEFRRSKVNNLIIFFSLIILFGCAAGKKHYDLGLQIENTGQYDQAIAYIKKAIEKEPNNSEYKEKLNELINKAIQNYTNQAEKLLDKKGQLTNADLDEVKSLLQKAEDLDASHAKVINLKKKVQSANTQFLERLRSRYQTAKKMMQKEKWSKAYFILKRIQRVFPEYEDSSELLKKCHNEGTEYYYQQAKHNFAEDNFKKSIRFLTEALSLDSGNKKARKLLKEAKARNNKSYFLKKGQKAIGENNWEEALKAYKKALEFQPQDEEIKQMIARVKTQARNYYLKRTRDLTGSGWILRAYQNFQKADKYIEGNSYLANAGSIKQELVTGIKSLIDHFEQQDSYGAKWYWLKKLKNVQEGNNKLTYEIRNTEKKIRNRVRQAIACFDFNSPRKAPDAGVIVANNLRTFFFNSASGDIKILERENLKFILEEMKLGQAGVISEETAKKMGHVYGISIAIMGNVLLYKVDSSSSKTQKTVRYKTGAKVVDNVDYLCWKAKHPEPTDEELDEAPPAKLKVPQFSEKDYEIGEKKKVAFVQLSIRIVDVDTGENIQVKTIKRKKKIVDTFHAGVPDAGIEYDPLDLPSNTELLEECTNSVVTEVGQVALEPLRNLEKSQYYNKANDLISLGNNFEAAEQYVNAIVDLKMKGETGSPVTRESRDQLNKIFYKYQYKPMEYDH